MTQRPLSYNGYTLVFEDHFDGPRLDRGHWNVELREPGWVNAELQSYVDTAENLSLRDSKLHIRARKAVLLDGSVSYTSGRINTCGRREFLYGIFEARLRVPEGKGLLPAFWLMTADEDRYGQWPVCGEIDIMEVLGDDTGKNHGTIHYGLPHVQNQGAIVLPEGSFSETFHTFSLLWEPEVLRWYVDGQPYHEVRHWFSADADGHIRPHPAPFDHQMYLLLNLAVGGSWVGYPDETTDFTRAVLEADYVRVYQKKEVQP